MACYQNPLGIFPNFFNLTKLTVDADLILVTPLPRCPGTSEEGGGNLLHSSEKVKARYTLNFALAIQHSPFMIVHECARWPAISLIALLPSPLTIVPFQRIYSKLYFHIVMA